MNIHIKHIINESILFLIFYQIKKNTSSLLTENFDIVKYTKGSIFANDNTISETDVNRD